MKSQLIFQASPWYILLCLAIGLVLAFVLYQKKSTLSKKQNLFLGALRVALVSLLCFLLLNPLWKSIEILIDKPITVLAIDNSASMNFNGQNKLAELKKNLSVLKQNLENAEIIDFTDNTNLDSLQFKEKNSNLSALLDKLKTNYEGRNVRNVILVSDGIINQGISPTYGKYNFNIHTVGIGDTIPKRDIRISAVLANKIAYLGNKFPIQAEILNHGFAGKSVAVILKQGGRVLDKQSISFQKEDELKSITFYGASDKVGMQRFTVEVSPTVGEFSTKNNVRDVLVDVVDGKEKILLLAVAPHPDIKAFRSIIEKNDLYEFEVKYISDPNVANETLNKPFDVLILHQLPDNYNTNVQLLRQLLDKNKPTFFVLGNQSSTGTFNLFNQALQIYANPGQIDKVSGRFNTAFQLFNLDADKLNLLEKLPPIAVPFGETRANTGTETILFQKVGNLATTKPLLAVNTTSQRKTAVLTGEGLWQWRMEEYALTEKQEVVDELILKTIQLISAKDDKRKLRIYPISPEFNIGEKVVFENEAYNDIYERIYKQSIQLELQDEQGKKRNYTYTTNPENTRFEISDLPAGIHQYKASTSVLGKTESVSGQFVITDTDLELQNSTADFNLLRTLAQQNKAKFWNYTQTDALLQFLKNDKSPDKVSSTESLDELINLRWLFGILLFLIATEWVIRKYLGTY